MTFKMGLAVPSNSLDSMRAARRFLQLRQAGSLAVGLEPLVVGVPLPVRVDPVDHGDHALALVGGEGVQEPIRDELQAGGICPAACAVGVLSPRFAGEWD